MTPPDFNKQEYWTIDDININIDLNSWRAILTDYDHKPFIHFALISPFTDYLFIRNTYPEAIKRTVLSRDDMLVEVDLSMTQSNTIEFVDLVKQLHIDSNFNTQQSTIRHFLRSYIDDPGNIIECTPNVAILKDSMPPLTLPVTLQLRRHQHIAIDYFARMERRVARDQPLGSFPLNVPVKRGGQLFWLDMEDVIDPMTKSTTSNSIRLRDVPDTQIEFTSRVLWFADESGLGKTITLITLILGTGPVVPDEYWNIGRPWETAIIQTTASLVIADTLMLRGLSDWRDLPGRLYPNSRVYIITSAVEWKELSRSMIKESDMIIMSYAFYKEQYRQASEYPNPEKETILSYHWQRIVFDDRQAHPQPISNLMHGWVHYYVQPFPHDDVNMDMVEVQTRPLGTHQWCWCPGPLHGSHLMRYIRSRCTWRRTVRSLANEIARPQAIWNKLPIPVTAAEDSIIKELEIQGNPDYYDVPVFWHCGQRSARRITVATPPSLCTSHKSFRSGIPRWKNISFLEFDDIQTRNVGKMRLEYGSLAMAILIMLREHWKQNPHKKALIVCQSTHAVACLGRFLKEQHVPIRTIGQAIHLKYSQGEHKYLKELGRKYTRAVLIEMKQLTVAVNNFSDIRHVFVLSSLVNLDPLSNILRSTVWNSIFRPISIIDGPSLSPLSPIVINVIHPGPFDPEQEKTRDERLPYRDMNSDNIIISLE
jgi:hypothetical protein